MDSVGRFETHNAIFQREKAEISALSDIEARPKLIALLANNNAARGDFGTGINLDATALGL